MYYNKNEFSIYYEKYGHSKKKIIILPGWGNTRKTFNNIINNLKKDYEVYILDYPGFGNSIFPDKDLTIYDYTNLIRSFIKDKKIDNPIIIAHSFGGRISTLISGYYKDKINKLILIDIAGIKHKKSIKAFIKQTTYKLLRNISFIIPKRKRNLYIKRLYRLFGSVDYNNLNSYMKNTFKNIINEDLKYYIKEIDVPTLIIWGIKDKDTPYKDALYINKSINTSELISLEAGHYSYLEKEKEVINEINNFLKKE